MNDMWTKSKRNGRNPKDMHDQNVERNVDEIWTKWTKSIRNDLHMNEMRTKSGGNGRNAYEIIEVWIRTEKIYTKQTKPIRKNLNVDEM